MRHRPAIESYAKMLIVQGRKFVRSYNLVGAYVALPIWLQPVKFLAVLRVALLVAIVLKPIHRVKK